MKGISISELSFLLSWPAACSAQPLSQHFSLSDCLCQASVMFSKTALVAAVLSQALPAFGVVHEQLAALPVGWTATSAADTSSTVSFTVALTQQNIDQLETKLLSVSTPGSATYGQHMDVDDLEAFFAPTAGASDAVESWLKRYVWI